MKKKNCLKHKCAFKDFQKPEFDQNLRNFARFFLYMFQVCSQKYRRIFKKILLSYIASRKIWLNLPIMDHRHFGYITNLTRQNKMLQGITNPSVKTTSLRSRL
jgi:hypothetical protein